MRQSCVPDLLFSDHEVFDYFLDNPGFTRRWWANMTDPTWEQHLTKVGGVWVGEFFLHRQGFQTKAYGVGDKVHMVVIPEPM